VFDSNLKRKWANMPLYYPRDGWDLRPPETLVKSFSILALTGDDRWTEVASLEDNYQRLVRLPLDVETNTVRLVVNDTWGADCVNVFAWEIE
jgi:hypothetical protein